MIHEKLFENLSKSRLKKHQGQGNKPNANVEKGLMHLGARTKKETWTEAMDRRFMQKR
jgi:hypothetical protein